MRLTLEKNALKASTHYVYRTFLRAKSILTSLLLTVSYIHLLLVSASSMYGIIVPEETVYTTRVTL